MARLNGKSKLWIHIIAWALFIFYELEIAEVWGTKDSFTDFACFYFLDICLFYTNARIIIQYAGERKKVLLHLIPLMLLTFILFFALSLAIGVLLYKIENHWRFYAITTMDIAKAIWRGVYITGLSTGYGFFRYTYKAIKETNRLIILQLETDKNLFKTKNAYLQSQINRHLLFNTLTFIYNSVFRVAPKAGQIVLLLSDIMHYALTDQEDGKVAITEEIERIRQYILLNELRLANRLRLTFNATIEDQDALIPPLLLLNFVENIFKHGDLTTHEENAVISISCKNNILSLHSRNFKKMGKLPFSPRQIGISNALTRLESFYGLENFDLNTQDTKEEFIIDLTIRL